MQTVAKTSLVQHGMAADPFLVDSTSRLAGENARAAPHQVTRVSGFSDPSGHNSTGSYDTTAPPPGLSNISSFPHQQLSTGYRVSTIVHHKEGSSPTGSNTSALTGSPKKPSSSTASHQSRHSLSKAPHLPFLNLASLKNYSAWPGSPVKPPTPLAVPPTPLTHPSAQAHSTPTHGAQNGSGKFLGALKLIRSDNSKSGQATTQGGNASNHVQGGTLHPFALPANEPQQYICYNLDASKGSPGPESSPLSPPPTPAGSLPSQHASQSPKGGSSMVLCTPPPSKPVPAPAPAQHPPKAEKPGAIPTCAKFLADGRLHPGFEQQYDILDELGSGGFGFVIRARRRVDGLIVAVKLIFRDRVGPFLISIATRRRYTC